MSTNKSTAEEKMYDALWRHAAAGDINAFERLEGEQKQEIDINWGNPDEVGDTYLMIASHNGHANMVAYLLGKGR